jgi:hypothetical protein
MPINRISEKRERVPVMLKQLFGVMGRHRTRSADEHDGEETIPPDSSVRTLSNWRGAFCVALGRLAIDI